ncbi:MAG: hypothetical protein AMJ79_04310 [Phycisphaerae bacterium SM23_30]|nr:MAG: hypothetical protein AMJ79_04310 [Phycisphaerae bacterium SM23_30]
MTSYSLLALFIHPVVQFFNGVLFAGTGLPQILFTLSLNVSMMPMSVQNEFWTPPAVEQYQSAYLHTGRVLDEKKQAVPGARVVVYVRQNIDYKIPTALKILAETETNGEGKFFLDMFSILQDISTEPFIVVHKEGLALGWAEWYALGDDPESAIILKRPTVLEGSVADQHGNFISGTKVRALLFVPDQITSWLMVAMASTDLLAATTDGYGKFSIPNIPWDATAEFLVRAPQKSHIPLMTCKPDVPIPEGQFKAGALGINLNVLTPSGSIMCRVVDQDTGSTLPEISVSVEGQTFADVPIRMTMTSDNDGNIDIPVVGGYYSISLVETIGSPRWAANPAQVTIGDNENVNITFPISRSALLELTLRDRKSGYLLSDVQVELRSLESQQTYENVIWGEPVSRFYLPAGRYEITKLLKSGYASSEELPSFVLKSGQTVSLDLKLDGTAQAIIFLRGPSEEPLAGVKIHAIPGDSPVYISDEQGRVVISQEEAKTTHFRNLFTLETDMFDIPMLVASSAPLNLGVIVQIPQNTPTMQVTLKPGFVISGQVVDDLGMPLENVVVALDAELAPHPFGWIRDTNAPPPNFPIQTCLTDYQGNYLFSGVAHGYNYRVTISKEGTRQDPILVTDDPEYINPNLKKNMSPEQIQSYIDRQKPRLPNLLEANQDHIRLERTVCLPANLALAGVVVDEMGHPLPEATVKIKSRGIELPFTNQKTDEKGRFRFENLPPGEIHLNVQYLETIPGWYYSSMADVPAGDENIYIIMCPTDKKPQSEIKEPATDGGLVQVKVIDAVRQTPIKSAAIYFEGDNVSNDPHFFTNSKGEASVVFPPGYYVLTDVDKFGKYRHNSLNQDFMVYAGQTETIVVEMDPAPSISGTIFDPEGKPVSGAELLTFPSPLYMTNPQFGCESQADGTFRFDWDADEAFEDREKIKCQISLTVMHERRSLAALLPLNQAHIENWDIVLAPTASIIGTITDASGKAKPDIEISVLRKRATERISRSYSTGSSGQITIKIGFKQCRTDAQGKYQLNGMPPLPEGYQYRLHIQNCDEVVIIDSDDFTPGKVIVRDVVTK